MPVPYLIRECMNGSGDLDVDRSRSDSPPMFKMSYARSCTGYHEVENALALNYNNSSSSSSSSSNFEQNNVFF